MNTFEQAPRLLTRKALAKRWGLSTMTIRRMEKAGKLKPSLLFGATARYSLEQVESLETAQLRVV